MNYFNSIDKVTYKGNKSLDDFSFKYYNPDEIVLGKPMKEHMRFSVCYWHTMTYMGVDPFGAELYQRNWFGKNEMETAKNRVNAFFELLVKLNVEYFCFHDVDIAPQGETLEEFFENLDIITDIIKEKMDETGIKLLWNTANLFSHPRFVKGAGTSPEAGVFAISAAQIKKGLEINKKLNGENYVFWGGREGYETLLNTDVELEQKNMAYLIKMAYEYAIKINHVPQFLLEPKPKEPMTHQYDFDASTSISFIRKFNLENILKLNLEGNHATLAGHTFEHEIRTARIEGMLGSLDANQGDPLLGWDIDEFPTDLNSTMLAMYEMIKNGGIAPGGINFDAKVRRTSFEMDDLILSHIVGMDTYARAFKSAVNLYNDGYLENIIKNRYISYSTDFGQSIINQTTDLESLADYAMKNEECDIKSDRSEVIKARLNSYIYSE